MEKTLTRRAAFVGTLAAAMAPATIAPVAKASAEPAGIDDKLQSFASLDPGEISAIEVTGKSFAPFYLEGEVVMTKEGDHRPGSHVVLGLKSGKTTIVELVHTDAKSAYVRGLKTGERMQVHPWKSVKSLCRIVATWRG